MGCISFRPRGACGRVGFRRVVLAETAARCRMVGRHWPGYYASCLAGALDHGCAGWACSGCCHRTLLAAADGLWGKQEAADADRRESWCSRYKDRLLIGAQHTVLMMSFA